MHAVASVHGDAWLDCDSRLFAADGSVHVAELMRHGVDVLAHPEERVADGE